MSEGNKHTELPWQICKHDATTIETVERCDIEPTSPLRAYRIICEFTHPINAAFIVRACNNHYELLDILTTCMNLMETRYFADDKGPAAVFHNLVIEHAKATISKAKGEK